MASPTHQPRVAIAQLNPNLEPVDNLSVHGIVTLVWPYNSITQSLGLLLVDPDFRLRRHQGQVRIQLLGSSAKAVSKAGVSSGDELVLSLRGASWEKDNESTNTPGRSIAWKLIFGERVSLETRSEGQPPRIVEVDHPPLSPELSRQASSPPSSPIYNSHIPTSSRKENYKGLNDNISTWSSPAFLKRSHFVSSSYDPFTELDDDFADNNRKKKTKFGLGSGQWKFVGNEPSPERDEDLLADREKSVSPSKPIRQTEQSTTLPVPSPAAKPAFDNVDMGTVVEDLDSSQTNGDVTTNLPIENEMKRKNLVTVLDSSASDRSLPNRVEEHMVFEPGVGQTQEGSPKTSDDQKTTDSPSAKPLSSQTSPSVVSVRDDSSTSNLESTENNSRALDGEGIATRSEAESGFGMDGSVLSKAQQAVNIAPMAGEIGRRWVEMQSRVTRARTEQSASRSGSTSSARLLNEPPVENLNVSKESSEEAEVSAPPRSGSMIAAADSSLEDPETKQDAVPFAKDENEIVSLEQSGQDEPDESSSAQSLRHDDSQSAEKRPDRHSSTSPSFDNRIESSGPSVSSKDNQTVTHQILSQDGQFLSATSQLSATRGHGLTQTSPTPPVVDVDMEDEDMRYPGDSSLDSAKDKDEHQITNLNADPSKHFVHDVNDSNLQFTAADKTPALENNDDPLEDGQKEHMDVSPAEISTAPAEASQTKISPLQVESNISSTKEGKINADRPLDIIDSAKVFQESLSDLQFSADTAKPNMLSNHLDLKNDLQDLRNHVELLHPEVQNPSTIPDTFESHTSIELSAEDNARQTRLSSQKSTSPIHYISDDEDQPMPSPVREINDSMPAQNHTTVDRLDEKLNESQDHVLAAKESTAPDDVPEEITSIPVPATSEEEPNVDSEILTSDLASGQKPLAQLSEELSEPNQANEGRDRSSGSSLITRLKELRRRSDLKGVERQNNNSTNPWFAPRVPSLAANGEVDTNVVSEPSDQIKMTTEEPMEDASDNPEKTLAQSFIRSSPTQSQQPLSPTTLTQESQYIPNSQQTTGFRTNLSYFVPVTSLHCHYGTSVDILAVAISSTPVARAPSGPRDNTQSIYITDPSSAISKNPSSLTTAQIFRPYSAKKESLESFPSLQAGDAILLRDFKVQSFQKSLSLISTDSSAWAVFRKDADVAIPGPPVEYGPEERAFARGLWDWWSSLEPAQTAALMAAVPVPKAGRAKKAPARKGLGFDLSSSQSENATKKLESSDNNIPTAPRKHSGDTETPQDADIDAKNSVKVDRSTPLRRNLRPRKPKGAASASPEKEAKPKVEEIHELRDGTRYVDRDGVDVEEVEAVNGVHGLRDGTRYRDKQRK